MYFGCKKILVVRIYYEKQNPKEWFTFLKHTQNLINTLSFTSLYADMKKMLVISFLPALDCRGAVRIWKGQRFNPEKTSSLYLQHSSFYFYFCIFNILLTFYFFFTLRNSYFSKSTGKIHFSKSTGIFFGKQEGSSRATSPMCITLNDQLYVSKGRASKATVATVFLSFFLKIEQFLFLDKVWHKFEALWWTLSNIVKQKLSYDLEK